MQLFNQSARDVNDNIGVYFLRLTRLKERNVPIFGHGIGRGSERWTRFQANFMALENVIIYLFNFGYTELTSLHGCSRFLFSLFAVAIGRMRPRRYDLLPPPRRDTGKGGQGGGAVRSVQQQKRHTYELAWRLIASVLLEREMRHTFCFIYV